MIIIKIIIFNFILMNSDSIFENEFLQKHKGILTLLVTISLAFFAIYWLYRGLQSNDTQIPNTNFRTNSTNAIINQTKIAKRRISISANEILFKDINNINAPYVYQILEKLSQFYDIYLIILIQESEKTENILENLKEVTTDKIVLKHVKII